MSLSFISRKMYKMVCDDAFLTDGQIDRRTSRTKKKHNAPDLSMCEHKNNEYRSYSWL